jgi:4-amino-4-deoxy-L-arabinose transferase-like glycosyltransferase
LQLSTLAKRAWLLLFIAITAFYLWGLGSFPLVGPDEPRYAQVAREMLARRDFITPTLGGLPWFEKPPLLYWMMMLSYRVLGVNEYAARLGPAICGLFTAAFIYQIGSAIGEQADRRFSEDGASSIGRWSALVWLSSWGAIGFSRGATFDIVLTMTITGALACFFGAELRTRTNGRESSSRWLHLAFSMFCGLSLLAKGLIGFVIIFGVIGLYFVLRREWPRKAFLISLIWGIPLSGLVASVWYGPMIARHGSTFIYEFIVQHHFARFATNKYHHPGSFYFYLPVLIGLALPWTIVLAASLNSSRRWKWRGDLPLDRGRVFALAWIIFPVVFFSFSSSKLGGYILPVLPAIAILVGERIDCFCRDERGEKVLRFTGILPMAGAVLAIWYAHQNSGLGLWTVSLSALPLFVVGALVLGRPQPGRRSFIMIPVAVFLTAIIGLKVVGPSVAYHQSTRDLLSVAASRGYGNAPVVQLHTIERAAEFYAEGRINYGNDGEPVKFESAAQVADAARRNGDAVLCFVPIEFESQLTELRGADAQVVADNGTVALLVVRAR